MKNNKQKKMENKTPLTFFLSVVLCAFIFSTNTAPAQETGASKKLFRVTASSKLEESAVLLKLKIKDAEPKSGVCPYYLKSFNYDAEKKDLSLEVFKEFCPNDQFGLSEGVSYWAVPKAMVGTKLCITVNRNVVGSIVIEGNKKSYRVQEGCD